MGMDWYEMIVLVGFIGTAYILALFNEHKRVYKLSIVGMLWIILLLYVQAVEKFTVWG